MLDILGLLFLLLFAGHDAFSIPPPLPPQEEKQQHCHTLIFSEASDLITEEFGL